MTQQKMQALLGKDQLQALVQAIGQEATARGLTDLKNEQLVLEAQLNKHLADERLGTADKTSLTVERNQIRVSLAKLIEQLYTTPPTPQTMHKRRALSRWYPALGIGFLLLSVITLFALMPQKESPFQAQLYVNAADFRLSGDWPSEIRFIGQRLSFSALQEIRGTDWTYNTTNTEGEPIGVLLDSASRVRLGPIYLAQEPAVGLAIQDSELILSFPDTGVSGEIQTEKALLYLDPLAEYRSITQASLLQWISDPGGTTISLWPLPDTSFLIPRMPISRVQFIEKDMANETVKSAILGGSIQIGSQPPISLKAEDMLELTGLHEADISLRVAQNPTCLLVQINGRALGIDNGLQTLHSLKPSWLAYFYHDEWWVLVATTVVSVTGMLWAVWKALSELK